MFMVKKGVLYNIAKKSPIFGVFSNRSNLCAQGPLRPCCSSCACCPSDWMILACSSKRLCKRTCGDAEKCTSRRVWYWPRESLKIETSILMEGSLWQTKSLSSAWRTIFKYRFPMVSYESQHSRPCPCRYTPRYGMSTIPTWKSLYLQGESHIIHSNICLVIEMSVKKNTIHDF